MEDINTNINDYSDSDLFSLVSLSSEIATKQLIQQNSNNLKQQFPNKEFHLFLDKVQERLIQKINKKTGFEDNIINFNNEVKMPNELKLINTNNYKYYDRNIVEKVLIIDTKYRDNFLTESSTNFNIKLPNVVKNVISIQLSDIEFPNTWFPFDEVRGNTYFHIKDSTKSEWIRIDISSQAYYYQDLFDSINNQFKNIPNDKSSDINNSINDNSFNSFEFIKSALIIDFAIAAGTACGDGTINF